MIERSFKIGVNAGFSVAPVVHVNQYDHDEVWYFTLVQENGQVYAPSTGSIVGVKADGNVIINSGTVNSSGQIVINETQQMTAAVGNAVYELVFDAGTHGTANFIVRVEPKPGDNATVSDSDISLIEEAIVMGSRIVAYGSPLVATTASQMTSRQNVYVYTGSESGYTNGHWYYWNGSAWTDGGVYNAVAVNTDKTLSVENMAADGKATGDAIADLKNALDTFENDMFGANKRVFNVTAGTTHGAEKGFWPVALKSGTQYSIDLASDAITGYQLYAYYTDGTSERIYSGRVFSNTYIAAKDIESFGFYIASSFIVASGEVATILSVSNGFYEKTINMQDTLQMTNSIVGENTLAWTITAGVAISADEHEIPVTIDRGETYSIKILTAPYDAVTAVQYWLMYADGTDERIYSSSYSLVYRGIAKKKIKAIRLAVGATGVVATGTCTIIIKHLDNTVASKLISEINKNYTIKVVNHRGYNTAPENTIPAYVLSYKAGFKYVETDVQLTSDGVPVLLHDDTINRTARTATGEELSAPVSISDITYAQALTYDFGIYKGTEYTGTKIPTLREFVMLCKRLGLHPYIEIKPAGFTEEQVKGLVDIVISCGMRDSVTWISQNHGYLAYVSNYCNKCRLGLVVGSVTSDNVLVAAGLKTTNNAVFVNSGSITADAVTLCIEQNLPLEHWTLNVESDLTTIDPYVSGISSDSINVAENYIERILSTGTATWS